MQDHTHELTLGLSFVLGAVHALEPGHGKTAMFVYLLGGRRSVWHPVVMGLTTAISHSLSLFVIAFSVHLTHHVITGDHHHEGEVSGTLQWVSALLLLGVGGFLFAQALRGRKTNCCGHGHHHDVQCCSESTALPLVNLDAVSAPAEPVAGLEQKTPTKPTSGYKTTALLGLAVGLLPCPSALAAYFTSLSSGSPATAYVIITLFAAGIACSISLIGIVLQQFGDRFSRSSQRVARIPWGHVRAGLIMVLGLYYTFRLLVDHAA